MGLYYCWMEVDMCKEGLMMLVEGSGSSDAVNAERKEGREQHKECFKEITAERTT